MTALTQRPWVTDLGDDLGREAGAAESWTATCQREPHDMQEHINKSMKHHLHNEALHWDPNINRGPVMLAQP